MKDALMGVRDKEISPNCFCYVCSELKDKGLIDTNGLTKEGERELALYALEEM
jgi:hypothetical protein